MENQYVLFEIKNKVAKIILNQPEKLNALSNEVVSSLRAALDQIRTDSGIRSVIITGAGKAFSAGGDLREFPVGDAVEGRRFLKEIQRVIYDLVSLEKPVIAAVNGYAVGGGCNLALACDLILASENATFSQVFPKVGLVPDIGGLYFLPRIVGLQRSKELMFSGRMISAKEAKEYGIVLEVTSADTLMTKAEELAISFSNGPSVTVGLTKSILNRSFEMSLEQVLQEEALAQGIAFTTKDNEDAVRNFFEKREQNYKGQRN